MAGRKHLGHRTTLAAVEDDVDPRPEPVRGTWQWCLHGIVEGGPPGQGSNSSATTLVVVGGTLAKGTTAMVVVAAFIPFIVVASFALATIARGRTKQKEW